MSSLHYWFWIHTKYHMTVQWGTAAILILFMIHHFIGLGKGVTFLPQSGMIDKFLVLYCLVSFEYTHFFQQSQPP